MASAGSSSTHCRASVTTGKAAELHRGGTGHDNPSRHGFASVLPSRSRWYSPWEACGTWPRTDNPNPNPNPNPRLDTRSLLFNPGTSARLSYFSTQFWTGWGMRREKRVRFLLFFSFLSSPLSCSEINESTRLIIQYSIRLYSVRKVQHNHFYSCASPDIARLLFFFCCFFSRYDTFFSLTPRTANRT